MYMYYSYRMLKKIKYIGHSLLREPKNSGNGDLQGYI